jgi:hypothetical protein
MLHLTDWTDLSEYRPGNAGIVEENILTGDRLRHVRNSDTEEGEVDDDPTTTVGDLEVTVGGDDTSETTNSTSRSVESVEVVDIE